MAQFWQGLIFSANIILPIVALLFVGRWLLKTRQIDEPFLNKVNHLLFYYGIPGLLFFSIVKSKNSFISEWKIIVATYLATLVLYFVSDIIAQKKISHPADRGVFVQGVFRGNLAIIGLAVVHATFGEEGLAIGAILAGTGAFLYNVLGVICLEKAAAQSQSKNKVPKSQMFIKILHNPLIIAIIAAIIIKLIHLPIPKVIINFGDLFTRITLPLSIICTGASFNFKGIFKAGQMAIWASIGRLIISPLCFVIAGLLLGVENQQLGILLIMGSAPAATASYIMAKALKGNAVAAANIVAITTIASLFIVAIPIAIFKILGWI